MQRDIPGTVAAPGNPPPATPSLVPIPGPRSSRATASGNSDPAKVTVGRPRRLRTSRPARRPRHRRPPRRPSGSIARGMDGPRSAPNPRRSPTSTAAAHVGGVYPSPWNERRARAPPRRAPRQNCPTPPYVARDSRAGASLHAMSRVLGGHHQRHRQWFRPGRSKFQRASLAVKPKRLVRGSRRVPENQSAAVATSGRNGVPIDTTVQDIGEVTGEYPVADVP